MYEDIKPGMTVRVHEKIREQTEKGEKERIVMIHAAIMGSIERFPSVLLDPLQGASPTWLAPVQARVISVSEKHAAYADEITKALKDAGIRAEADNSNESLGKKIREAKGQKIPYLLVVGDKEVEAKMVSVDSRDHGKQDATSLSDFIAKLQAEIRERR